AARVARLVGGAGGATGASGDARVVGCDGHLRHVHAKGGEAREEARILFPLEALVLGADPKGPPRKEHHALSTGRLAGRTSGVARRRFLRSGARRLCPARRGGARWLGGVRGLGRARGVSGGVALRVARRRPGGSLLTTRESAPPKSQDPHETQSASELAPTG